MGWESKRAEQLRVPIQGNLVYLQSMLKKPIVSIYEWDHYQDSVQLYFVAM